MKTLVEYLEENVEDSELKGVILSLAGSVMQISDAVKVTNTGKAGTMNVYGEEQIALDVVSDRILTEELAKNSAVAVVASEEMDDEKILHADGRYGCCYDPLDGSSLFDVNLTVGTIVGIYETKSFLGIKGDDQVAALVGIYGPRTLLLLTVRKGTVEFTLEGGEFVLSNAGFEVNEFGKMFAPGNLKAAKYRQDYLETLEYWVKNEYKLRYSGGMVPDVYQILVKRGGIFVYPGYEKEPEGKLRLLYECAPMALIMEEAGGGASDGSMRILDKELKGLADRSQIFIGSKGEVADLLERMG